MILLYLLQGLHVEYQEASGVHVVLKVCDLYTAGNGICLYPLYDLLIRLIFSFRQAFQRLKDFFWITFLITP